MKKANDRKSKDWSMAPFDGRESFTNWFRHIVWLLTPIWDPDENDPPMEDVISAFRDQLNQVTLHPEIMLDPLPSDCIDQYTRTWQLLAFLSVALERWLRYSIGASAPEKPLMGSAESDDIWINFSEDHKQQMAEVWRHFEEANLPEQ